MAMRVNNRFLLTLLSLPGICLQLIPVLYLYFLSSHLAFAQRVEVPGTLVSMVPPKSFVLSENFTGFKSKKYRNSTISVSKYPGSFQSMLNVFAEPVLESRGLVLRTRESMPVGITTGEFFRLLQISTNQPMHKWILIFGDHRESITVTAAFPDPVARDLGPLLEQSLSTVLWDRFGEPSMEAALPYRFDTRPHFQYVKRIGNLVLYTADGQLPVPQQFQSLLTVTVADYPPFIEEQFEFARAQLELQTHFPKLEKFAIASTRGISVDEYPAAEITALATDMDRGEQIAVWYVLIYAKDKMFHLKGTCERTVQSRCIDKFRSLLTHFSEK